MDIGNDSAAAVRPAVPPLGRLQIRKRVATQARSALVVNAILVLVFVMPADGFITLTRIGGTSVTNLVGYLVFLVAVLRLPAIVRSQPGAFWCWAAAFLLGTIAAAVASLTGPMPFGKPVFTLWQMVGLWALTTYAVSAAQGGERVVKTFLVGMAICITGYVVMHSLDILVGENVERTITVAGYQANHASYNAVFTFLLIIGTNRWWSRRMRYLLLGVAAPACLYVVMLANSRGAVVSLAAGMMVFLVPGRGAHRFRTIKNLVVLAGAGAVLIVVIGMHRTENLVVRQLQRWTEPTHFTEESVRRTTILRVGLKLAVDQPLGYGIGNAERLLGRRQHRVAPLGTHDDYLRTLLACGVLGLVLYLVGHGIMLKGAVRELRRHGTTWALAVLVAFQVFCLSADNDPKETWIFLGLITGLAVRRRRAEKAGACTS